MASIPGELNQRLMTTLLRCGPFDSDRSLRPLFVDARLSSWRDRLPEAASPARRVSALIDMLSFQRNTAGESALCLFLRVLSDQVAPGDACHGQLAQLADELGAFLEIGVKPPVPALGEKALETEKTAASYRASGQFDQAISIYQKSSEFYRELGDRSSEMRILDTIGSLYRDTGDLTQAQKYYEKNLVIARDLDSRNEEANALQNLGNILRLTDDFPGAIALFTQAEEIWRTLGDSTNLATVHNDKGITFLSIDDFFAAEHEFQKALVLSKKTGNIVVQATIVNNLALTASQMGHWEEAITFYNQALQIYEQQLSRTPGDFFNVIPILVNIGSVYTSQQQWSDALEYYQRAITLTRRSSDRVMEANILGNIGNVLVEQGAFDEAVKSFEQALRIHRSLGDQASFERIQNNIRAIEQFGSRIARVQQFFEKAGFKIDPAGDLGTFICKPTMPYWKNKLKGGVYACLAVGEPLDREIVLSIHAAAQKLSGGITQVFVLVDKTVRDDAWLEIGALRSTGFDIMPVTFTVLYESQTTGEPFAERMALSKHLNRFLTKADPYNVRHPVWDRLDFFGRETLSRQLVQQLIAGQPVGLFGLRKMGKSSLMRYMQPLMPCPTAWIDLQAGVADLADLYQRIFHAWHNDARIKSGLDLNLLDRSLDSADPTGDFSKFTKQILEKLLAQGLEDRLAIFLDEIELLIPPVNAPALTLARYFSLMRMLRGLVQEDGRISLMVAGVDPTINRVNRLGSEQQQNPFYKLLEEVYLPPLHTEDCIQMIRNIGLQAEIAYTEDATLAVAEFSGGHPFLARQLCSLAYQQLGCEPGEISLASIEKASRQFIFDPQYATFLDDNGLWGEISNVKLWSEQVAHTNQALLSRLAQCPEPCPESVIVNEGDTALLRSALYSLKQLHIIQSAETALNSHSPGYSITFGLFRSWIRQVRLGLQE